MTAQRWYVIPRLELVTDDVEAAKQRLAQLLELAGFAWVNSKTVAAFLVDEAERPLPPVGRPTAAGSGVHQGKLRRRHA